MYFHGVTDDGLRFHALSEVLGPFCFRTFQHDGAWFAVAKTTDAPGGGVLLASNHSRKVRTSKSSRKNANSPPIE
jgi:hypothetical protein